MKALCFMSFFWPSHMGCPSTTPDSNNIKDTKDLSWNALSMLGLLDSYTCLLVGWNLLGISLEKNYCTN